MNKVMALADLINIVAEERGLKKTDVKAVLQLTFDQIAANVTPSIDVRIHGFGTFKMRERPARKGRNPSNGEVVDIPASSTIVFKATKIKK